MAVQPNDTNAAFDGRRNQPDGQHGADRGEMPEHLFIFP